MLGAAWGYLGYTDPKLLEMYWQVGLPGYFVGSFLLGGLARELPWRWPVIIIAAHLLVAAIVSSDGDRSQLPLGLLFYCILVLPGVVTAYVGAWGGKKLGW